MPIYNMVRSPGFVPPTWAGGTDAEIVEMLEKHYVGEIDLTKYWHVGDERVVHLSAMSATYVAESYFEKDVTLVLVNIGGKTLNTPINGKTECAFIWQVKNPIGSGYMNSSRTNSGGWANTKRRSWCNNIFYAALPEYMQTITKEVENKTISTYNAQTATTTVDKIALPARIEAGCPNSTGVYEQEGSIWSFYTDATNRIKSSIWWSRSLYAGDSASTHFFAVNRSGNAEGDYANDAFGINPFGCI